MRNYLLFLVFILPLLIHSQCGQYTQIKNERLSHVRFWDENNGFVMGGATLLTTNNGGTSWSTFDVRDFQRLTINPLNEAQILNDNKAIIVGDDGIILKTDDRGLTWNRDVVRLGNVYDYRDVHFIDENVGYLSGSYFNAVNQEQIFLYRTNDGGDSWEEVLLSFPSTATQRIVDKIYFLSEDIGFMTTIGAFGATWKTINGGNDWVEIDLPISGNLDSLQFVNNQLGYAQIGSNIVKTEDAGETWTDISVLNDFGYGFKYYNEKLYLNGLSNEKVRSLNLSNNLIEDSQVSILAYQRDTYFVNENIGYAVGQKEQGTPSAGRFIIKTIDGGQTWQILDGLGTIEKGTNGNANFFSRMSDETYIYSFTTSQFGTSSYIMKSQDNGSSWQMLKEYTGVIGETLFAENQYMSHVRYSNPNNSADPSIYSESYDGGLTWQDVNSVSSQILSVFTKNQQISQNEIYTSNFSQLMYSSDKGNSWESISIPQDFELWSYNFIDNQVGYIKLVDFDGVQKTAFYKTNNRGQSWEEIITFEGEESFPGYDFLVKENGELVIYPEQSTGNLYLYDGFSIVNKPFTFNNTKFQIIDNNSFVLINNDLEMFISKDNGDSWEQRFFINLELLNNLNIYVENNDNIFLWDYNYIEHLKSYYPDPPDIIKGQTENIQINQTYTYDVPLNLFTLLEWEISEGLLTYNVNNNAIRVTARWTAPGIQFIRARYVNDCGESDYAELQVDVEPLNIDFDNFLINTVSETCIDENNGIINISASETYNYTAVINNQNYNFTEELILDNLAPGEYQICITVPPTTFEQCFNVSIESAENLTGRFNLSESNMLNIQIDSGTAPYYIYKNEELLITTNNQNVNLDLFFGDELRVSSSKQCEGYLSFTYSNNYIRVYPNSTNGKAKIISQHSILGKNLRIYSLDGKLIESTIIKSDTEVDIDISEQNSGVYFLSIGDGFHEKIKLIKL